MSHSDLREFFRREMSAAKRDGSWFRLGSVERGVYSLAMRLDVKLESAVLLRALVGALKKLKEMGDGAYASLMDGMRLAWAFSDAAVSWGNEAAKGWRSDASYASFLGRFLVGRKWP
ncbi:MAG: hypothetical protein JRN54_05530 [Nitrososphaerota archaeon]|nr:hypothetical protein [Nitrososphaerota archaeon]